MAASVCVCVVSYLPGAHLRAVVPVVSMYAMMEELPRSSAKSAKFRMQPLPFEHPQIECGTNFKAIWFCSLKNVQPGWPVGASVGCLPLAVNPIRRYCFCGYSSPMGERLVR